MSENFCLDSNIDWNDSLSCLLFASHETSQESVGFAPFEMFYGRQFKGPFKLVKDQWLQAQTIQTQTVTAYADKLQTLMSKVRKLAHENLLQSQGTMKFQSDKNAKVRKLKPTGLLLAYFPIPGSPLQAKFSDPYEVI